MDLPIRAKVKIAAKAGIDPAEIPAVEDNAKVNPAIAQGFENLTLDGKQRALPVIADEIIAARPEESETLTKLLRQHGYEYIDGGFHPSGLFDAREARYLPPTATSELSKAFTRLSEDDKSGAITAACGAVDGTTISIYQKFELGRPPDSFQAKVNTVLDRLQVFDRLTQELLEIGLSANDAEKIATEMWEATKHAAEALQVIRRAMGDVHSTKPAHAKLAYETVKWAAAICGLLDDE